MDNLSIGNVKAAPSLAPLMDAYSDAGLSNRESEVGALVTKGFSNKETAEHLFVTEKTVKFHLTNIYKKLNIKSRAQLIIWSLPKIGEGVRNG